MKTVFGKIATAAAALFAVAIPLETAQATKVTLDGSGYYDLGSTERFYANGRPQSGRYTNLGADYYRNAEIGIKRITNRGTSRSGSMSFELWAMPYYGATSGVVLMTNYIEPLRAGYNFTNVVSSGKAVSLNRRRFPELDLFEYTSNGWKWRDVLVFSSKTLL